MSFKEWKMEDVQKHNQKVSRARSSTVETLASQRDAGSTPAAPRKRKPAYTEEQVRAWCVKHSLPEPLFELQFHPTRKWRFDIALTEIRAAKHSDGTEDTDFSFQLRGVAIEIQGGIWVGGGHSRGAQMKKDWEKWMEAQRLGWKMAWREPKDLLTEDTAKIVLDLMWA